LSEQISQEAGFLPIHLWILGDEKLIWLAHFGLVKILGEALNFHGS